MFKMNTERNSSTIFFENFSRDYLDFRCSHQLNVYNEVENIISRISCIDSHSKIHFSKSSSFRSFISDSLEIIESENGYHQTRLERLFDNGEECYRFTYYLCVNPSKSITSETYMVSENKIYKRLLKNLSNRDKQLRLEMILDERVL